MERPKSAFALAAVALAWATAALLLSRSAWNGRGSILNSRPPSWTTAPSWKGASSISPLTRALTVTILGDERYPLYASQRITSRRSGRLTVTVGGGGACAAGAPLQPARSANTNETTAVVHRERRH